MAMRNSPSLRLHIRPERIRHGVDLCQILRLGPDIPVGQSTGGGGALPAAEFPNLVRKHVFCGGQGLVQRGLYTDARQRGGQLVPRQRFFPRCGRMASIPLIP